MVAEPGASSEARLAQTALHPSVRAGLTTQAYSKQFGKLDITALVNELSAQIAAANKGDLQRSEAMLVAHTHTLDAIFNELMRRAQSAEYLPQFEAYMRLGLKAQGQCRATIETLAAIKNPPPVAFVRQANIAHGPQQVNNGPQPADTSRARESEYRPNELLEHQRSERLDSGAPQTTIGTDSGFAPVGALNGTEKRGR